MIPLPGLGDLREAITLLSKPWRAFRGYRLLVFGTKGAGKTTLWRHLETGTDVSASISSTLAPEAISKFKLRDIKVAGLIRVRILGVDVPGDPNLRSTWEDTLYNLSAPPHGIIFMLDNVEDTDNSVPSVGYDQQRLKEHRKAFEHLSNLIFNNSEIMDALQALLILVNKNDSWGSLGLQHGDIIKAAGLDSLLPRFEELQLCRRRAQPCSALYGSNIQGSMAWMA